MLNLAIHLAQLVMMQVMTIVYLALMLPIICIKKLVSLLAQARPLKILTQQRSVLIAQLDAVLAQEAILTHNVPFAKLVIIYTLTPMVIKVVTAFAQSVSRSIKLALIVLPLQLPCISSVFTSFQTLQQP